MQATLKHRSDDLTPEERAKIERKKKPKTKQQVLKELEEKRAREAELAEDAAREAEIAREREELMKAKAAAMAVPTREMSYG